MKVDQILKNLNQIEKLVSQTRDLLFSPKGIRITLINREDLSLVEFWQKNLEPKIYGLCSEKSSKEDLLRFAYQAITTMTPSQIADKGPKEIYSDLDPSEIMDSCEALIVAMNEVGFTIFNKIDEEKDSFFIKQIEAKYGSFDYNQEL